MLCHLGIFVFFVSRNLDDKVLCRVERRQADVASDTFLTGSCVGSLIS